MPTLKLDIRHLQMIRAIWQTGRVNDAADLLGLTPSALSHRAKEAERRLGVVLFERSHKRLRLTAAAEYLADVSDRVLSELETVEDEVRRMNAGVDHVVRVAVETYEAYGWLPGFTDYLAAQDPRISIQIVAVPAGELSAGLLNRKIDLGLCFTPASALGVQDRAVFQDRLVFVCGAEHPLANRPRVFGQDIEGERFITYSKRPAPDQEFARIFRAERRYPRWAETAESPAAILALIEAGRGTSVLSHWAVTQWRTSCALVELGDEPISVTWSLRSRSEDPADGPSGRVARALRDYFATA